MLLPLTQILPVP